MKFIAPSWSYIFDKSVELAEKIRKESKQPFESIIGVSRGGLALTRLMSDLLDIQDVMITRCEYYSDLGARRKHPVITQKIQGEIKGRRVLLVDDVADTGESLKEIKRYLRSLKPKSLALATLYIKPWSTLTPDFFVGRTDAWIIFPWEPFEAIKSLSKNNGPEILSHARIPKAIVRRLGKMDKDLLPESWRSALNIT